MPRFAIIFVVVMLSGVASAKPRIAVAPVKGDSNGEIADALADLLGHDVRVTTSDDTGKAMVKLGISGELDDKSAKKLIAKLGVDAVLSGHVEKKGKKKTLKLSLRAKGKSTTSTSVPYKSVEALRDNNKEDLATLVAGVTGTDDEEDKPPPKKRDPDEDRPPPKKRDPDEDKPRKKVVADRRDGDDDTKVKKKKKRHGDDDDKPARAAGAAFRVDAGATYGVRRLTYESSSTNAPPTTGTAAPSGMVELEVFPFAANKTGTAGLGIYGGYDKTFGLSISIPGTAQSVPIDQVHYWVGARYRFPVGTASALGFGVGYDRRHYLPDRTNLVNPEQLDTPDTDYASVAPDLWFTTPVANKVMFFGQLDGLLLLSSGAIASSAQFGHATAYGVTLDGGVDIMVSDQFVLRLATQASQVSFSFNGMKRGVSAATDRSIGLVAALGVAY